MKYSFRINEVLKVCRSKELDDAGDYVINCFRVALGANYFNDIKIIVVDSHKNHFFHLFLVNIDSNLSSSQIKQIEFQISEHRLNNILS